MPSRFLLAFFTMVAVSIDFASCFPPELKTAMAQQHQQQHQRPLPTSGTGSDDSNNVVIDGSGSQLIRLMMKVSSGMDDDGTALMELCKIHAALSSIADHVNEVITGAVGSADVCLHAVEGTFLERDGKGKDEYTIVD